MTIQFIFVIISYFGLYNLSIEPGYELFLQTFKKEMEEQLDDNEEQNILSQSKDSNIHSTSKTVSTTIYVPLKERKDLLTFGDILTNMDILLLIISSSFSSLLASFIELQTNMFCVNILKWSLNKLSGVTFIAIGFSVLLITITHRLVLKYSWMIYPFYVVCFLLSTIVMCSFMLIYATNIQPMIIETLVVCMVFLWNLFCTFGALAFGRFLLFTLVPLHSSSHCEGIRNSASRISCGLAYFLAAPTFNYLFILYTTLCVIIIVLCFMFYIRRATFTAV